MRVTVRITSSRLYAISLILLFVGVVLANVGEHATSVPSLNRLLWIIGYVSLICCIATSVVGLLLLTRNANNGD